MSTEPSPIPNSFPIAGPAFRRRRIAIDSPTGAGVMTGIEMGPNAKPIDLVFVHANGFNAMTYRRLLSPLADQGLRILAVDQRGHGLCELEADPGDGHGSWLGYRDDLVALLVEVGTPRVLAGHSMGGTTSLLTARSRPDLAPSLVVIDPVVMPEGLAESLGPDGFRNSPLAAGARRRRADFASRQAALEAYTGRGAFRNWPVEMLADYVADGFRDQPDGTVTLTCAPDWEAANFAAHHHNPWDAFLGSRCPIRVLRASEGSTANILERVDELRATGRIRVETVPDTSHFLPMEMPELVRGVLLEALAA